MEGNQGRPIRKAKELGRVKGLGTLYAVFNTVPHSLVCELHIEGIEIW